MSLIACNTVSGIRVLNSCLPASQNTPKSTSDFTSVPFQSSLLNDTYVKNIYIKAFKESAATLTIIQT